MRLGLCKRLVISVNKMKRLSDSKGSETPKKAKTSGFWANGLLSAMEDPESRIKEDDLVVVIKDKFPKAKFHYLVLPKEDIHSLKKIDESHLPLLEHMHKVGVELTEEDEHKDRVFKLGYHAEASMARLHLHVISDDMDSPCTKTKKHWNSYNTDFFLSSEDVCESLKSDGKVAMKSADECKKLMSTPLQCHKCDYVPKHMPDLKKHILKH